MSPQEPNLKDFQKFDEWEHPFLRYMKGLIDKSGVEIDTKIAQIQNHLELNREQASTFSRLPWPEGNDAPEKFFTDVIYGPEEPHASAWMGVQHCNRYRATAAGWPLQGIASAPYAVRNTLHVLFFPLDVPSSAGVAVGNLHSHINSKEGVGFVKKHMRCVSLPQGACAVIPAGFLLRPAVS